MKGHSNKVITELDLKKQKEPNIWKAEERAFQTKEAANAKALGWDTVGAVSLEMLGEKGGMIWAERQGRPDPQTLQDTRSPHFIWKAMETNRKSSDREWVIDLEKSPWLLCEESETPVAARKIQDGGGLNWNAGNEDGGHKVISKAQTQKHFKYKA